MLPVLNVTSGATAQRKRPVLQAVDNHLHKMAALLSAEVHAALTQLLHGLQSPDNVLRTQAESQLATEWSTPNPGLLLVGLVEQGIAAEDTAVWPRYI